ncbi:hypothetical protein BC831DRAFT_429879 [Entophlyctis helioformis]|nr:hypothetical protein BC831DRAFT_429879 [Entophlyctis helioformis]
MDSAAQVVSVTDADTGSCPPSGMTLTIRLIKSFEYRTTKNLVLHNIQSDMLVGDLKALVVSKIKTTPGFKPYLTTVFDALKLYVKAHGSKAMNLIINLDHDEDYFMDDSKPLQDYGVENETEMSLFNLSAYEAYKKNPEVKWE